MDDASGLQTSGNYGTSLILNPLRQRDNYANSDFDVRHIINSNAVWQIPVGRGRWLLSDTNKVVDAFLGGWQLSGIFRWNSGLPIYSPYDDSRWATNWNIQSSGVRVRPVETCPTRGERWMMHRVFSVVIEPKPIKAGATQNREKPATATLSECRVTSASIWDLPKRLQCRGVKITDCKFAPRLLT
ncbi:MAG: hypothetical protein WKF71_15705 [Pyrinomonadaceae bacterium]